MKRESTTKEIIGDDILLYLKDDIVDLSKHERPTGVHGTVMAIEGEGIYVNGANGNSWLSWYQDGIGTSDFQIDFDFKFASHVYDNFQILLSMAGSNTTKGVLSAVTKGSSTSTCGWFANGDRIMHSGLYQLNTWYHYTFKRQNGLFELSDGTQSFGTSTYNISGNWDGTYYFGANQSKTSEHMNGFFKNLIIKTL